MKDMFKDYAKTHTLRQAMADLIVIVSVTLTTVLFISIVIALFN